MPRNILGMTLTLLIGIAPMAWVPGIVHSANARHSTGEGVFSDAQSMRGRSAYLENCSVGCHGPTLTGGDRAPSLAGDAFIARWKGLTVDALFQRVRSTMPQGRPGSLRDATYIDIIAFLLDANGFPSAAGELVADSALLGQIIISDPSTSN